MPTRWWINQINTTSLEPMVAFYKELGFVEDEGGRPDPSVEAPAANPAFFEALAFDPEARTGAVVLRLPGDRVRLALYEWTKAGIRWDEEPAFNDRGLVRVGLEVDDLDGELERLHERGVPVTWVGEVPHLQWGPIRFALLEDPDGNIVEFAQGTFTKERT
jgi:catechol 2,3-dioxygenase-like lactoylglutathione lyase family enzyme